MERDPARFELSLMQAMKLTAHEAQAVFRALVDTTANPGEIVRIGPVNRASLHPVLLPVVTLADVNTTVAVLHHGRDDTVEATGRAIGRVTGAAWTDDPEHADLVVSLGESSADLPKRLRVGSAAAPELGAKVFIACQSISTTGAGLAVTTVGPGASAGRQFHVSGLSHGFVEDLGRLTCRFPAGVDAWFVADDGACVGIPRSNSLSLAAVA